MLLGSRRPANLLLHEGVLLYPRCTASPHCQFRLRGDCTQAGNKWDGLVQSGPCRPKGLSSLLTGPLLLKPGAVGTAALHSKMCHRTQAQICKPCNLEHRMTLLSSTALQRAEAFCNNSGGQAIHSRMFAVCPTSGCVSSAALTS